VFTLLGNELTAPKAFTSLAIFQLINFPLNILPRVAQVTRVVVVWLLLQEWWSQCHMKLQQPVLLLVFAVVSIDSVCFACCVCILLAFLTRLLPVAATGALCVPRSAETIFSSGRNGGVFDRGAESPGGG
jgi:hypothetical protein